MKRKYIGSYRTTSFYIAGENKKTLLIMEHAGNMGDTIEKNVIPNMKVFFIDVNLYDLFEKVEETGSPDYLYTVVFDMDKVI